MKKTFFVLSMLMVSVGVYCSTFTVTTPSTNVVLKFDGQIVTAPTINISSPYFPTMTLTKAQFKELKYCLDMLDVPVSSGRVIMSVSIDTPITNILNPEVLKSAATGTVKLPSTQPILKTPKK